MAERAAKRAQHVASVFSRRFQCTVPSLPGDRVEYTESVVSLFRADGSLVGAATREAPWFSPARKARP